MRVRGARARFMRVPFRHGVLGVLCSARVGTDTRTPRYMSMLRAARSVSSRRAERGCVGVSSSQNAQTNKHAQPPSHTHTADEKRATRDPARIEVLTTRSQKQNHRTSEAASSRRRLASPNGATRICPCSLMGTRSILASPTRLRWICNR